MNTQSELRAMIASIDDPPRLGAKPISLTETRYASSRLERYTREQERLAEPLPEVLTHETRYLEALRDLVTARRSQNEPREVLRAMRRTCQHRALVTRILELETARKRQRVFTRLEKRLRQEGGLV